MTDSQGNETVEEKLPAAIPTENKPAESDEPKLPDGVSERTKEQFDKIKEHNAQLKAELDAYKSKTSVLDELRVPDLKEETPNLSTTEVAEIKSKFVDDNGYIDVAKIEALDSELRAANERAKRAEDKADRIEKKIQNSEETVEIKAVHAEYPQLDPHNEKFDPNFYKLVKLELVDQMMNGEKDLKKAAQAISKLYTPQVDVQKAQEEAVVEFSKKTAKRSQASEDVTGRGKGEPSDKDEMSRKTQQGDVDALYKRLQASGN